MGATTGGKEKDVPPKMANLRHFYHTFLFGKSRNFVIKIQCNTCNPMAVLVFRLYKIQFQPGLPLDVFGVSLSTASASRLGAFGTEVPSPNFWNVVAPLYVTAHDRTSSSTRLAHTMFKLQSMNQRWYTNYVTKLRDSVVKLIIIISHNGSEF